jgi:hypothetical protein
LPRADAEQTPQAPLEHDLVTALNNELLRIEAREKVHDDDHHLGHGDRVHFEDSGEGNVTLSGSLGGIDFDWFGPAKELLERLRKVPSGGGAEGVRSEFS